MTWTKIQSQLKFCNTVYIIFQCYNSFSLQQLHFGYCDSRLVTESFCSGDERLSERCLCSVFCRQGAQGLLAVALPRDKDPFWDPVEPLLLGTAHLWLQSLAFRIPLDEQLEVPTHTLNTDVRPKLHSHGDQLVICMCRCWGQRARRRPFYKRSWSPAPPLECIMHKNTQFDRMFRRTKVTKANSTFQPSR